jgi:hypothetical protein
MAYRQNDPLIASQNAGNYVFRAVRECGDLKGEPKRKVKRILTPGASGQHNTYTSLSGFWCSSWPLGADHSCIPPAIHQRAAIVTFKRVKAEAIALPCIDDADEYYNHIDIQLPVYLDDTGNTSIDYLIKRDQLVSLLELLWTDCEPPINCT